MDRHPREYRYRSDEDRVANFIKDHLDLSDPEAKVPFAEVYGQYKFAFRAAGLVSLSDRKFGPELDRVLKQHGRKRVKGETGLVCIGVRLKPDGVSVCA